MDTTKYKYMQCDHCPKYFIHPRLGHCPVKKCIICGLWCPRCYTSDYKKTMLTFVPLVDYPGVKVCQQCVNKTLKSYSTIINEYIKIKDITSIVTSYISIECSLLL